ncbi:MAG TPA: hypothetical protein VL984_01320 [Acidimicrobiales bacterium]|nr:hypothetical protein [Acidimicrobiales bacterium]
MPRRLRSPSSPRSPRPSHPSRSPHPPELPGPVAAPALITSFLGWPTVAATSLGVTVLSWRNGAWRPVVGGLDSWQPGLALGFLNHIQWGPQLIFTFGPYGFVEDLLPISRSTAAIALIYALVVSWGLAALIISGLRRGWGLLGGCVAAWLALVIATNLAEAPEVGGALSLGLAFASLSADRHRRLLLVTLAAFSGFQLLVEANVGALGVVLTLFVVLARPARISNLLLSGLAFAAVVAGSLAAAGQHLTNFPSYLRASWSVLSGYASAMSLTHGRQAEVWFAIVDLAMLAAVVTLALLGSAPPDPPLPADVLGGTAWPGAPGWTGERSVPRAAGARSVPRAAGERSVPGIDGIDGMDGTSRLPGGAGGSGGAAWAPSAQGPGWPGAMGGTTWPGATGWTGSPTDPTPPGGFAALGGPGGPGGPGATGAPNGPAGRGAPRQLRAPEVAALVLGTVAWAWESLKEGFVRHDKHDLVFFAVLLLGVCLVRLGRRSLVQGGAIVVAAVLACVAAGGVPRPARSPIEDVRALGQEIGDLSASSRWAPVQHFARVQVQSSGATLPEALLRRLGGKTFAAEQVEDSLAFAYPGLNWDPEPVLQSYNAYTTYLDDQDASFLAGARAPELLLFSPAPIDGRNQAWEPPATMAAMYCHYASLAIYGRWLLLGRVPDRCGAPQLIGTTVAHFGQTVPVPTPPSTPAVKSGSGGGAGARTAGAGTKGEIVEATFDLATPRSDQVEGFLLKPPAVWLTTGGAGGQRYRFVSGTATDVHVMSAPSSLSYPAAWRPATVHEVELTGNGWAPGKGTVKISFYAVPFSATSSSASALGPAGASGHTKHTVAPLRQPKGAGKPGTTAH